MGSDASASKPAPIHETDTLQGGIRIDGNPQFIDAVLSQLTDLLDGENTLTRLELSRSQVDHSRVNTNGSKCGGEAEVCYIRLHRRG